MTRSQGRKSCRRRRRCFEPFCGRGARLSTDVAVLGVHLDSELFPLRDLGFKAVASAGVGFGGDGRASAGGGGGGHRAHRDGPRRTAQRYRSTRRRSDQIAPIVGGDLARSHDVAVAVTVLGECPGGAQCCEVGPRRGDDLLVLDRSVVPRRDCVVVERALHWTTS